uniref:CARD domain-containing protein n=1 Tax=Salarias fasciatus TaxID=181472 RepID=A0A672J805_SALFA
LDVASVEKKLFSIRKGFIDRVSSSVVKDLLDILLQRGVINYNEKGQIQAKQQDRDISEELIDMMLKKGHSACKILIDVFCQLDPYLSADLKLP